MVCVGKSSRSLTLDTARGASIVEQIDGVIELELSCACSLSVRRAESCECSTDPMKFRDQPILLLL